MIYGHATLRFMGTQLSDFWAHTSKSQNCHQLTKIVDFTQAYTVTSIELLHIAGLQVALYCLGAIYYQLHHINHKQMHNFSHVHVNILHNPDSNNKWC